MSNPTKEQVEKIAQEIRVHKQMGFLAHLSAQGVKEAGIREMHAAYIPLDKRREDKYNGLRAVILGE